MSDEKQSVKRHVGLVIALVFGLVVRVWWLNTVNTQPVTDFDWYFERARGLVDGLGYSVEGDPTAYWPVGYPGVLAFVFRLFGVSVLVGKMFNTLLILASIALSFRLALVLFKDNRVAVGVAFVLAVHPAFVAYSGILASEPLYTCLTLAGALLCLDATNGKPRWLLVAGLIFGVAVLVRPQAVLIPGIVLVCSCFKHPKKSTQLRSLVPVYIAIGLVLVPWTVRNFSVFEKPVFVSTNGGDNLLIGNNPIADGKYHSPLTLGVDLENLDEVERDRTASRAAIDYARTHFGATVSRWPAKLVGTFLSGTDAPYWAFQKTKGVMRDPGTGSDKGQFKMFRSYSILATFWLLVFAGLGVILGGFKKRLPIIGLALIGYSGLLSIVFFGNPRFAFAVVPFIAMHAVHSLVLLWDAVRHRSEILSIDELEHDPTPTVEPQNS